MEKNRIKYYGNHDLSTGLMLKEASGFLDQLDLSDEIKDINDALEIFNVIKLIDNGRKIGWWNEEEDQRYFDSSKQLKACLGRFCTTIDDEQFISMFDNVEIVYRDDFFGLLETYGVFGRISDEAFMTFLCRTDASIWHITEHRKLVNRFDSVIAEYMIKNSTGAELLCKHYYSADNGEKKHHIPKNLTENDKRKIIIDYINSEDPNPNYLSLVIQPIEDTGLRLDDRVRYLALKRREERFNDLFSGQGGFKFGAEVSFENCDEGSVDISDPLMPKIVYSRKWVEENTDYPTLLNNLIYMFEQVDRQNRCTFVSKKNNLGVFERHLGIKSKREYEVGVAFQQNQIIHILNLIAYDRLLQEIGIDFEDIIRWFFVDYLYEEFGADGFIYAPSGKGITMTQKCRNLLCEMDSLLKQFKLYVEDGEVNRGLLEFSSTPVSFESIPSFVDEKYAYLKDEEMLNAANLLFSDQTMLGYTEKTGEKYNTIVELLLHEDVSIDDYAPFQMNGIQYLIEKHIINCDAFGKLILDKERAGLLKDFYENEVINVTIIKNNSFLKELIDNGRVLVNGTLFSVPEQDYLDYVFNHHKYTNGPDLRNRYIHGTNPKEDKPEDYYRCLLNMCLMIIKINEEFCVRDKRIKKE